MEKFKRNLLTAREMKVLELRFGFGFEKPLTIKKTAEIIGLTYAQIRIIEQKAIRKVRYCKITDEELIEYLKSH